MQQPKPQEEEEQEKDSWTHIPTKPNRRNNIPNTNNTNKNQPSIPPFNILNPPSKTLSLPSLTTEFHSKLQIWKLSPARKTTLSLLSRVQPSEKGWNLQKAICLGSGSLSRENFECRRRSLWQFVVFWDLATYLLAEDGVVYAQEPAFTELDGEFLTTLGIKILPSKLGLKEEEGMGAAGKELGPSTFLFEPFVDMTKGMLESMLERDAGLYVGSSVQGILERREGSEVGKLARRFREGREMRKFPVFEVERNVLEGLGIWWREEEE